MATNPDDPGAIARRAAANDYLDRTNFSKSLPLHHRCCLIPSSISDRETLERQFASLRMEPENADYRTSLENPEHNRYNNIPCLESTRVILPCQLRSDSDYINANLVHLLASKSATYIATQVSRISSSPCQQPTLSVPDSANDLPVLQDAARQASEDRPEHRQLRRDPQRPLVQVLGRSGSDAAPRRRSTREDDLGKSRPALPSNLNHLLFSDDVQHRPGNGDHQPRDPQRAGTPTRSQCASSATTPGRTSGFRSCLLLSSAPWPPYAR